jgi:hypothetical protein
MILNSQKDQKIFDDLYDFKSLYEKRPIKDNSGGMKSPHMFGLFLWLRENKPDLIVESGIWKGQGTWLIKEVCPNSKVISIDINMSNLLYKNEDVNYYDKDIETLDLKNIVSNFKKEKVLVFFDDHQDFNKRLDFLIESGIKHVIYEDNYPLGQGDCISPKKIFSSLKEPDLSSIDGRFYLTKDESIKVINHIVKYEEFSPIFTDRMTRWGIPWTYETKAPLLSHKDKEKFENFFLERFDYTWMCYLELLT